MQLAEAAVAAAEGRRRRPPRWIPTSLASPSVRWLPTNRVSPDVGRGDATATNGAAELEGVAVAAAEAAPLTPQASASGVKHRTFCSRCAPRLLVCLLPISATYLGWSLGRHHATSPQPLPPPSPAAPDSTLWPESAWCPATRISVAASSVYSEGTKLFVPNNAIDGIKYTNADGTLLAVTQESVGNWLSVVVPRGTPVEHVVIYNRGDNLDYMSMLSPFEVWVYDILDGTFSTSVRCAGPISNNELRQTVTCEAGAIVGNYVQLMQVGSKRHLAIAELEVYQSCPPPPALPAPPAPPRPPSPPPSPPLPPWRPMGYREDACGAGEVCVGHASCVWPSATVSPDTGSQSPGSLWATGRSVATYVGGPAAPCVECGCRPITWPVLKCNVTFMLARMEPTFIIPKSGWASLVNSMLTWAPSALNDGYGIQLGHGVCADEDRSSPHCFFRPLSNCGDRVEMGWNFPTPWPTDADAEQACRRAAAILGVEASCEGRLASWRLIAKLVLRVQPDIEATIQRTYLDGLPWAAGRYAAMHVRRGDKVSGDTKEAVRINECTYADWLARLSGDAHGLNVFIATDDLSMIDIIRGCEAAARLGWQLHHFEGEPGRGTGRDIIYRLYAELSLLVRAEWVVVTYSSNIGRLVQLLREQPEHTCASLDDSQSTWDENDKVWHPDISNWHEWHEGRRRGLFPTPDEAGVS